MKLRFIATLLLALLLVGSAKAEILGDTLRSRIYFRVGVSKIDLSYQDNGYRLESLIRDIHARQRYSRLRSIRLTSGASVEGNSAVNKRLSDERLVALRNAFQERIYLPESIYEYNSLGENWEGLLALVEESNMPFRDEALNILRNTPIWVVRDGQVVDGRKRQLMNLRGGSVWRHMEMYFFPELRNCTVVECEFEPVASRSEPTVVREVVTERDTVILRDTVERVVVVHEKPESSTPQKDTPAMKVEPIEKRPFYMALKTNLLYDAAFVPNVGVEFGVGDGWSLGGTWVCAWWRNDSKAQYWRIYGGELDIRKYFGRKAALKPLQGHHVGLYIQAATYDFETGKRGNLCDFAYGLGFEYGYSLPLAKRLNIDFGIGLGYSGGNYKNYDPDAGCYVYKETKQRHWFGPTRAEVSLVWLLGRGNVNSKKGGEK